ncbi:hypothetical protein MPLB_2300006 [Mesorhizobium sp. ORS 3324]|nr:hypothetical protein MPLB_2300006 [Mesorhizobium sp. ORS 3324]
MRLSSSRCVCQTKAPAANSKVPRAKHIAPYLIRYDRRGLVLIVGSKWMPDTSGCGGHPSADEIKWCRYPTSCAMSQ